ncbi:DUF4097 family beta strand repeat-containing protein [Streptomyces sp. H27-H5]|uniref:DUF4097 family beta strand repeat-containing protein n=1 Tax=Streptomyces sp. H27-H5 TaxID=2996460 RepID=UPI00226DB0C5|nr:DUF4097 family beta strand repeat-containing protein [Streptomyces sp. H27-H5]MCY0961478.1 DUF4097 family beta strand repeat-containing protein [Streptomyces sp. H27-H5]
MTSRRIPAERTGPVTIDAALLGYAGTITVRAEPDCERATLTIRTADEEGEAADLVRDATLRQSGTGGLYVSAQGKGANETAIIATGGRHVVQSIGVVTGSVTGMMIIGNDVIVNGAHISANGGGATAIKGGSPIEITAIVPEGSSVIGRTHSAHIVAEGALLNVTGHTQSGHISAGHVARVLASTLFGHVVVERAAHISATAQGGNLNLGRTDVVEARTVGGDIRIRDFGGTAQLETVGGDIRVHATVGGTITARTVGGDIEVTATEAALDDSLDIQTNTMGGRVRTPQGRRPSGGPRRRSL